MICWVRSAMRAARSVGRPIASSKPLVCRLCVPPRTAAMACTVTRAMLFSGCCAVSVEPPVWVWNRSSLEASFLAPSRPELGDLLEHVVVGVPEERQPRRELVDVETGVDGGLYVGDAVGDGEGD